jgi:SAM-dependent methyltransferase
VSQLPFDPAEQQAMSFRLFSKMEGAVTSALIHLGGELGLYEALATGPATSAGLAERTGLNERWVREWLYNQAAAELINVDPSDAGHEVFSMSPAAVAVLADKSSPVFGLGLFHSLPATVGMLGRLAESFRTGIGHPYDVLGDAGARGIEMSLTPWNSASVVPVVLPALDGVVERLDAGAAVADIGCGTGTVALAIAAAFPRSRVTGYDISAHALRRAAERLAESGLTNLGFADPRVDPLPADGSLDLVSTFDCMHDMTRPDEMAASIRRALGPDGTWLLAEVDGRPTFAENTAANPLASLFYGTSVLTCLSSSMSEPGARGFGTLALHHDAARELAEQAGFTRFRRLPVDHRTNAFYEIRP